MLDWERWTLTHSSGDAFVLVLALALLLGLVLALPLLLGLVLALVLLGLVLALVLLGLVLALLLGLVLALLVLLGLVPALALLLGLVLVLLGLGLVAAEASSVTAVAPLAAEASIVTAAVPLAAEVPAPGVEGRGDQSPHEYDGQLDGAGDGRADREGDGETVFPGLRVTSDEVDTTVDGSPVAGDWVAGGLVVGEGDGEGEEDGEGEGEGEGDGEGEGVPEDGSAWHIVSVFAVAASGAACALPIRPRVRKLPLSNVTAATLTCTKRIRIACLRSSSGIPCALRDSEAARGRMGLLISDARLHMRHPSYGSPTARSGEGLIWACLPASSPL